MTPVYGVTALVVVGALFVLEAHRLAGRIRRGEPVSPMRLFHWSTTYLTLLFVAIAVDALIRRTSEQLASTSPHIRMPITGAVLADRVVGPAVATPIRGISFRLNRSKHEAACRLRSSVTHGS